MLVVRCVTQIRGTDVVLMRTQTRVRSVTIVTLLTCLRLIPCMWVKLCLQLLTILFWRCKTIQLLYLHGHSIKRFEWVIPICEGDINFLDFKDTTRNLVSTESAIISAHLCHFGMLYNCYQDKSFLSSMWWQMLKLLKESNSYCYFCYYKHNPTTDINTFNATA